MKQGASQRQVSQACLSASFVSSQALLLWILLMASKGSCLDVPASQSY